MKKAIPYLRNKYLIALVIFIAWLFFFDKNNIISQYSYTKQLRKLKQDKLYYKEEITKNKADLEKLMTDPKNLEKFAREKYLMKKDNEDVFVIVEENNNQ